MTLEDRFLGKIRTHRECDIPTCDKDWAVKFTYSGGVPAEYFCKEHALEHLFEGVMEYNLIASRESEDTIYMEEAK